MTQQKQHHFPWIPLFLWIVLFSGLTAGVFLQEKQIPSDYRLIATLLVGIVPTFFLTIWLSARRSRKSGDPLAGLSQLPKDVFGLTPYGSASSSVERAAWYDLMRCVGAEYPMDRTLRLMLPAMQRLFPGSSVALYVRTTMDTLALQLRIGDESTGPDSLHLSECEATEKGRTYVRLSNIYTCAHHQVEQPALLACSPIVVDDRYLGLLTLSHPIPEESTPQQEEYDDLENRLLSVTAILSLYLHNQTLKGTLVQQNIRDPLTGLFNRRYMEETLLREFAEATRRKIPIGLIVIRPLDLSTIQEEHGSKAADQMAWEIGQRLPSYIRTEDIPCRLDDRKFCVILPGASREITLQRAKKIQSDLSGLSIGFQGKTLKTNFVTGISVYPEDSPTVHGLVSCATQGTQGIHGGQP